MTVDRDSLQDFRTGYCVVWVVRSAREALPSSSSTRVVLTFMWGFPQNRVLSPFWGSGTKSNLLSWSRLRQLQEISQMFAVYRA